MWFELLLGHLVGDYLLQNNWMALGKAKHTKLGYLTCLVHCLFYTAAVCAFMQDWSIYWILAVFLSHFPIDKFGLAEIYLKFIQGRSLEVFMNNPENAVYTPYVGFRSGFTIFVYVVVDNTMHLVLLYYAWELKSYFI